MGETMQSVQSQLFRLISTPRGMLYALFTVLIVLNLLFGLWFIKVVAVLFLAQTFLQNYMDGFSCLRCWLGFVAALGVASIAFGIISPRFYMISFVLMWADAFMHTI